MRQKVKHTTRIPEVGTGERKFDTIVGCSAGLNAERYFVRLLLLLLLLLFVFSV
jgi:hypothetical protein